MRWRHLPLTLLSTLTLLGCGRSAFVLVEHVVHQEADPNGKAEEKRSGRHELLRPEARVIALRPPERCQDPSTPPCPEVTPLLAALERKGLEVVPWEEIQARRDPMRYMERKGIKIILNLHAFGIIEGAFPTKLEEEVKLNKSDERGGNWGPTAVPPTWSSAINKLIPPLEAQEIKLKHVFLELSAQEIDSAPIIWSFKRLKGDIKRQTQRWRQLVYCEKEACRLYAPGATKEAPPPEPAERVVEASALEETPPYTLLRALAQDAVMELLSPPSA